MVESVIVKVNIPIELFVNVQDSASEDEQDIDECINEILECYFCSCCDFDGKQCSPSEYCL